MTVAGTAMTLPRRRGVRGMHALPGGWQEAWGRCPCAWAGISTQTPPPPGRVETHRVGGKPLHRDLMPS